MSDVLPWLEYKWSFDFPVGMYRAILERMRGTSARLEEMLKGATRETLVRKPGGKWSIQEQVGHLWALEELHHARLEQYLRGETQLVAADMTNRKTNESSFNQMTLEEILRGFRSARWKDMHLLDMLTLADAARVATHPRLGVPMRLVDMCYFVAEHDDHHLAAIRVLLAA